MKIAEFQGVNRFLSNFWPVPSALVLAGTDLKFTTVEHAYQAAKVTPGNRTLLEHIWDAPTPGQAKRRGREVPIRAGWDGMKLAVMENLVRQKFDPAKNPHLWRLLVSTGDAVLEEGNKWGDRFWGVCGGTGENHLGKILMKVRAEFSTPAI
jgi:ribA/ribD-fused uncharacterized protein